jgi:hypothetical protein
MFYFRALLGQARRSSWVGKRRHLCVAEGVPELQVESIPADVISTEHLADKYRVPLYTVNCASLGTEPDVLETRLAEVLRSAANWKVVLVLDDATLFLYDDLISDYRLTALRSAFHFRLTRSDALVCMTAFESGIPVQRFLSHVSVALRLQGFSDRPSARSELWASAIRSLLGDPKIPESDLTAIVDKVLMSGLARNMDGREIHACVRAALALAKQNDSPIKEVLETHILEVMRLADDFKKSFCGRSKPSPALLQKLDK